MCNEDWETARVGSFWVYDAGEDLDRNCWVHYTKPGISDHCVLVHLHCINTNPIVPIVTYAHNTSAAPEFLCVMHAGWSAASCAHSTRWRMVSWTSVCAACPQSFSVSWEKWRSSVWGSVYILHSSSTSGSESSDKHGSVRRHGHCKLEGKKEKWLHACECGLVYM